MPIGVGRADINIGDKTDLVSVPYGFGENTVLDHLNTLYYHVHGKAITYPKLADSVNVIAGAGVWNNTGTITEVIPAGVLNIAEFDLHWIIISGISANGEGEVVIYAGNIGNEVEIESAPFFRNAVQSQEGSLKIQIPQQPAGTRISCKVVDNTSGALNVNVKFKGHYYA